MVMSAIFAIFKGKFKVLRRVASGVDVPMVCYQVGYI
jgi:hypothetical protein